MKKIIFVLLLVAFLIGTTIFFTNKTLEKKQKYYEVDEVIEENNLEQLQVLENEKSEVANQELNSDTNKEEVKKDATNESKKQNVNEQTKKEKVKETTKQTPKVDKVESTKKETTESKTESVVEETKPIEKHKCTNNDSEYIKWLNEFKSNNDTSRIFYSKEDAINYGENVALENGYGYFYNKSAISYENDYCKMDIYTVRLYIPAKTCEDNKMMYLKANEEVIHSFSYLKKLGYECKDKVIS